MNKYEGYREISLPWLKCIPKHWKLVRNKNIFSESKDTVGECFNDYTLLSLTLGGVIIRDLSEGKGKFPKDFETYKVVKQGDIIFCLFDMDETPRTVGLSKNNGMITGAYDVFHINGVNSQFIYYYYLSLDNAKALRPLYSGLRKTIKVGAFLGAKVPLPPRDEQDQIVRFLDWKVSSINRLINIKKKEIKEIESLKKSLIDNCVTHGLNPDVPMKDSGVKWLGKIPAHWGIAPLCAVAKEKSICNCINLQLLSVYLDVGVVPFTEKTEKRTNATSKDLTKYQRVDPCDFVLNNQQAWRGSVGISFHTGIVSPAYIVLSMDNTLNSYFANFLFRSRALVDQYLVVSKGVGSIQRNIYWTTLKRAKFVIPPLEEQNNIVKYLENRLNKYDNFIERIKEEIALLNELKLRLISDVVTGKIDVRDVKIPSFDMVEEDVEDEMLEDNDETDESEEVKENIV